MDWKQFVGLPGNEIYANLEQQAKLPGMNAGFKGLATPIGETDTDGSIPVKEGPPIMGEADPPATYARQWFSPVSHAREQNAGVEIMSLPTLSVVVTAGAANVVRRVAIPRRVQLVVIGSTDPAVFVGRERFTLPLPATAADIIDVVGASTSPLVLPINRWWYVDGVSELYIGIVLSGASVSIGMYEGQSPRV